MQVVDLLYQHCVCTAADIIERAVWPTESQILIRLATLVRLAKSLTTKYPLPLLNV
jgi:hypothetical protein